MSMDSERFPVKCYGDLGERTFGRPVRHLFNILQSKSTLRRKDLVLIRRSTNHLQRGDIAHRRGEEAGLDHQLSAVLHSSYHRMSIDAPNPNSADRQLFMLVGLVAGQIRSLRGFSWFTNVNVWLSIIVMILTMVGTGLFDPVPSQSGHVDLSEPIMRAGWVPTYTVGWYQQVSGVQLAVFSYGGAMIFTGTSVHYAR